MSTSLGDYIEKRRIELGYTSQAGFARAAKISPSHLNQIEGGKIALPNADLRRKLARALGVRHVDILVAAGELAEDEAEGCDFVRDLGEFESLVSIVQEIRWNRFALAQTRALLETIRDFQSGKLSDGD